MARTEVKFDESNICDVSSSEVRGMNKRYRTDGSKFVETSLGPRNHYFIIWQETLRKAQSYYVNGTEMVSYLIRF